MSEFAVFKFVLWHGCEFGLVPWTREIIFRTIELERPVRESVLKQTGHDIGEAGVLCLHDTHGWLFTVPNVARASDVPMGYFVPWFGTRVR